MPDNILDTPDNISTDFTNIPLIGTFSPPLEIPEDASIAGSENLFRVNDSRNYERFFGQGYDPTSDLEGQAGLYQSNFERWGKFIPRVGVKIASEVAQMPGYMVGLADWASTGFQADEIGRMVDNQWIKAVKHMEETVKDKALAIYVPDSVKNGNLLDNVLSPAFWATEGADGIGFLAAMLVPGMATRGLQLGAKTLGGLRSLNLISKTLKPGSQAAAKAIGNIDDFGAAIFNTLFEAGAEAGETFREVMESSQGDRELAGKAAAGVMGANALILLPSNILMQKWLMGDAFEKWFGSSTTKGYNRVMTEATKGAARASKKAPGKIGVLKEELETALGAIKPVKPATTLIETIPMGIASEGFWEEGMQFATSDYFKKRAEGLTDKGWLSGTVQSYIDEIGNIDMQKSIFLGSFLGGLMGGAGGFRTARRENEAVFGSKERLAKDITLLNRMVGQRARQETKGYKGLIQDIMVNRYETSDIFKYKLDKDGNKALVLNKAGLPIIDMAKFIAAKSKLLGTEIDQVAQKTIRSIESPETAKFLQYFNDFNTMLPFFNMEGGMELLDDFLDNIAVSDVEYMKHLNMSGKTIADAKKNLKTRAKEFKDLHKEINKQHISNMDIKPKPEQFNDYIAFDKDLFHARLDNELKQNFFTSRIDSLGSLVKELQREKDAKKITSGREKQLNWANTQVKKYQEELDKIKEEYKSLYGKEVVQKKFDDYVQQMESTRKVLETAEKEDAKDKIDESETKEEVAKNVEEYEKSQPVDQTEDAPADTIPPTGKKEEPAGQPKDFNANLNTSVQEQGEQRKKELETQEALNKAEADKTEDEKKLTTIATEKGRSEELPAEPPALASEQHRGATKSLDEEQNQEGTINIALKTKVTEEQDGIVTDVIDEETGRAVLQENADLSVLLPDKYRAGTKVVLFVDENYEGSKEHNYKDSYQNTKDNIDEIPIGIKILDEFGNEAETTLHIHTLSWIEANPKPDDTSTIKITKKLREAIVEANEPMVTSILGKTTGWTFKQIKLQSLLEAFKSDPNIFFGLGAYEKGLLLSTKSNETIISNRASQGNEAGFPYALVPLANGTYVASFIERAPLASIEGQELYHEYIDNVIAILTDFSKSKDKEFFTEKSSIEDLLTEVRKFFFASNEYSKGWAEDQDSRLIFNIHQTPGSSDILMELRYKGEKTDNLYNSFVWKDGTLYARYMQGQDIKEVPIKDIQNAFRTRLVEKYAQLEKKHFLEINREDAPKFYSLQVIDGKLTKVEQSYLEFLDNSAIAGTKIYGVDVDGKVVYTAQPNISILSSTADLIPLSKYQKDNPIDTQHAASEDVLQASPKSNPTMGATDVNSNKGEAIVITNGKHKGRKGIIEGFGASTTKVRFEDGAIRNIANHNVRLEKAEPELPLQEDTDAPQRSSLFDRRGETPTPKRTEDDTISDNMVSFSDIDYNNTTLGSLQLLDNYEDENEIVSSLTAAVLKTVSNLAVERGKKDKTTSQERLYQDAITIIRRELEIEKAFFTQYAKVKPNQAAIKQGAFPNMEDNQDRANLLGTVTDNFNPITNKETNEIIFIGYRERILLELDSLKFNLIEQSDFSEEEKGILEKTHFSDVFNYTNDPEKSMSARTRRALFFIPKLNEQGQIETNVLGLTRYENYLKVHNRLKYSLSDIPIQNILPTLRELAKTTENRSHNFYSVILDELEGMFKDDESKKREFLTVFRNQSLHFKILLYNEGPNGQSYWRTIDSNRAGANEVMFDLWHENFKVRATDSGILKRDGTTLVVDKQLANRQLGREFRKITKNLGEKRINIVVALKQAQKLLLEVGIDISDSALEDIQKDRRYGNKRLLKRFNLTKEEAQNGVAFLEKTVGNIIRDLTSGSAKIDETYKRRNPFFNQDTLIKGFASYEVTHNPDLYTASFRNAEGMLYYSFVNPHYLSDRMLALEDEKVVEKLIKIAFLKSATWLNSIDKQEKDFVNNFKLFYFDATKNEIITSQLGKYEEQNDSDKNMTRVSLFQNGEKKTSYFFTNTPADKTGFTLIQALKHELNLGEITDIFTGGEINLDEIDLDSTTVEALYKIVEAEMLRVNTVVKEFNALIGTKYEYKLIPNYHYIEVGENKTKVLGGGGYIFSFPQLNNVVSRNKDGSIILSTQGITTIKKALMEEVINLVNNTLISWDNKGIINFVKGTHKFDQKYIQSFSSKLSEDAKTHNILTYAAAHYTINTLIAQMNMFQLFTGDPATFTSAPRNWQNGDWATLIDSSATNIFKRVAKDIAPGEEGFFDTNIVKYVFLNEPKVNSELADLKGVLEEFGIKYTNLDIADAQEWTTATEHINVLYAFGRLREEERNLMLEKLHSGQDLSPDQLARIMQPQKPVYTGMHISEDFNVELPIYLKTSSFPLIPQITRGSKQLEAFRKMLEGGEAHGYNKINRAVVASGVKVGYMKGLTLFDEATGKIKELSLEEIDRSIHSFSRDGFKNQQDVPYKENKQTILYGSQIGKFKFANLAEGITFDVLGEEYNGHSLKKVEDQIRNHLYKARLDSLLADLNIADIEYGIPNVNKLRLLIIEEALERDYSFNDLLLLSSMVVNQDKTEFTVPLFFHTAGPKIESLLNSIISNRVLKNNFAGKSFVQGSSVGFEFEKTNVKDMNFLNKTLPQEFPVLFTKEYDGKQLKYEAVEKDGEKYIDAQVLMPSFFRRKGKRIDMRQFVKDGYLDLTKIDPELLTLIGYRIPTQGFNSMIRLKVVGFLPDIAGDLIIVPPEITKQMGADFDVDKLFTHFFNYDFEETDKGVTRIFKLPNTLNIKNGTAQTRGVHKKVLENYLLDINLSILQNTKITKMSLTTLDNDVLTEAGKTIQKLLQKGKVARDARLNVVRGEIQMQVDNIEKIKNGQKTITSRNPGYKFYTGDGIYTMSDGTMIRLFFIEEAHVTDFSPDKVEEIAIKEGFASTEDMAKNSRPETKNWLLGKNTKRFFKVELVNEDETDFKLPTSTVDETKASASSILYDGYQTHVLNINADGQVGIAMNSVAAGQHVLSQHAGLHLQAKMTYNPNTKKYEPDYDSLLYIKFKDSNGNVFTDTVDKADNRIADFNYSQHRVKVGAWRLDKIYGFTEKLISEVLTNLQNASVDNANKQELFGVFLTKETFTIATTLARLGLDENYITAFINQPIIREYIVRLKEVTKITDTEYKFNAIENLQQDIQTKYASELTPSKPVDDSFSLQEMEEMIENGGKDGSRQIKILKLFLNIEEVANKLQSLNVATNTDTKLLDKDIYSSIAKKDKFNDLEDQMETDATIIGNLSNYIEGTVQGGATQHGLIPSIQLFSNKNIIPMETPLITTLLKELATLKGDMNGPKLLSGGEISHFIAHLRGAMFNLAVTDVLNITNVKEEHNKLMYTTEDNLSLGAMIQELKAKGKTNNFIIQSLQPVLNYDSSGVDIVKYDSSKEIKNDVNGDIVRAWNDLLNSHKNSLEYKIGRKLILYTVLNGNDRNYKSFGRFLPQSFYINSGLYKVLRSINFVAEEFDVTDSISHDTYMNFTQQYVQHFPTIGKVFSPLQVHKFSPNKNKKLAPDIIWLKKETEAPSIKELNILVEGVLSPSSYIYTFSKKEHRIVLYQYVGNDTDSARIMYKRLPTLGDKQALLTEFNLRANKDKTIFPIKEDKNQEDITKPPPTVPFSTNVPPVATTAKQIEVARKNLVNRYRLFDGSVVVSLQSIADRGVIDENRSLAKLLLERYAAILGEHNIEEYDPLNPKHSDFKADTPGVQVIASLKYNRKLLIIDSSLIKTEGRLEEILLHEIAHLLTGILIRSENLTGKSKIARENIIGLFNELRDNKDFMAEITKLLGENRANYMMGKPSEFISYIIGNKNIRDIMNNTMIKDKNLLTKFFELISELLNLNIKEGSALEGAYQNILQLMDTNIIEQESKQVEQKISEQLEPTTITPTEESGAEEITFDSLPHKSEVPKTMTYGGVGSRNTPTEIQKEMESIAEQLYERGFTANTGDARGADAAFRRGATKKNVFTADMATDTTRKIAKEVHPTPFALKGYGLDLMARNTYQVFGKDLKTPIDFLLVWTHGGETKADQRVYHGKDDIRNTGGTGQAIALAELKGIPVINMANSGWAQELNDVVERLENMPLPATAFDKAKTVTGQAKKIPLDKNQFFQNKRGDNMLDFSEIDSFSTYLSQLPVSQRRILTKEIRDKNLIIKCK